MPFLFYVKATLESKPRDVLNKPDLVLQFLIQRQHRLNYYQMKTKISLTLRFRLEAEDSKFVKVKAHKRIVNGKTVKVRSHYRCVGGR